MTADSATEHGAESEGAWRVSLAFWFSLLLAAAIYASVALAPKLLAYVTTRSEFLENQANLVALEQRVAHLERVRVALENDPGFAAELARIEFDEAPTEEERIAVEPLLSLESIPRDRRMSATANAGALPWYTPLLERFAGNRTLRMSCLAIAAVVTLGAFTFLHEPDETTESPADEESSPSPLLSPFRRILARYRRVDEDNRED